VKAQRALVYFCSTLVLRVRYEDLPSHPQHPRAVITIQLEQVRRLTLALLDAVQLVNVLVDDHGLVLLVLVVGRGLLELVLNLQVADKLARVVELEALLVALHLLCQAKGGLLVEVAVELHNVRAAVVRHELDVTLQLLERALKELLAIECLLEVREVGARHFFARHVASLRRRERGRARERVSTVKPSLTAVVKGL